MFRKHHAKFKNRHDTQVISGQAFYTIRHNFFQMRKTLGNVLSIS